MGEGTREFIEQQRRAVEYAELRADKDARLSGSEEPEGTGHVANCGGRLVNAALSSGN